jgi:SAM-dependent methyltransferase
MSTENRPADNEQLRDEVRKGYARVAVDGSAVGTEDVNAASARVGYQAEQLEAVPDGANLGVGCGNPTAIDSLSAGEVVVDLGSGAGMDSFLAAAAVGPTGRVIGVDMTDEMLEKARANAEAGGYQNVEFRKGFIEQLPLEDESVDVILSNCVINLSPEKEKVYAEAYRVLRPGGRVMVSDIVLDRELPAEVLGSIDAWIGCVGGASLRERYLDTIREAGFASVEITKESCFGDMFSLDDPDVARMIESMGISREQADEYRKAIVSLHILARK